MSPSVYINPTYRGPDRADGGIRRVVEALARYLPDYGWYPTDGPDGSDLIMNHGTLLSERPGVPMIAACHGLYWHDYSWPLWSEDANRRVIETMVRADAITAPSSWVAGSISRGLSRRSTVIYHGVDIDEWQPTEDSRPFVLWNKARKDAVSNPEDMQRLAAMLPNLPFVSTLGEPAENVRIVGVHSYEKAKEFTRRARIYLGTVRETMGIGTLEALASGVPVVGWDFGGQHEIIRQGETGLLVPYGDYGMLAEALQTVWNDHSRYSRLAREDAVLRWQWPDKIQQYVDLFDRVLHSRVTQRGRPKVSIVVTCYNLAQYLQNALQSVSDLAFRSWECLIVDDCSTDGTESIGREWDQKGFRYLKTSQNLGLSGARNFGASSAEGDYLIFLDADDMLDRNGLQDLVDVLDNDRGIHITYGALDTVQEDGSGRSRNPWPSGSFDWRGQIAHLNQLPYASLIRRSAFDAIGGYRVRDWRAEDASFWVRASSYGFRIVRGTERSVLVYRNRNDSKSGQERRQYSDADGDWTSWFPWRLGARSGDEGAKIIRSSRQPNPFVLPFGAQGSPPAPHLSWPVRHHASPLVSVVIPVGPDHEIYLPDALDSLVAQTFLEWEAIVVNDTGVTLRLEGFPWARVIETEGTGRHGAGYARNRGIESARGPLLFFLDADDWLRPDTLEKMIDRYARDGGYIYSDCVAITDSPIAKVYTSAAGRDWHAFVDDLDDQMIWKVQSLPYDRKEFLSRGYTEQMPGAHSVSILIAKVDMEAIGGFDEGIAFWEDWEAMLKAAKLGLCGHRVEEPLLTYRLTTGRRRRASKDIEDQIRKILADRYVDVQKEVDSMCNCGGGGQTLQQKAQEALSPFQSAAKSLLESTDSGSLPGSDAVSGFRESEKVYFKYIGTKSAPVPYVGKVTGKVYRASRDPLHEVIEVDLADAEIFSKLKEFVLVRPVSSSPVAETVQW